MITICEFDDENISDSEEIKKNNFLSDIFPLTTLTNTSSLDVYEEIINLVGMCKILNIEYKNDKGCSYNNIFSEPFFDIKKSLLENLGKNIGFNKILDGMSLIIGEQYSKFYDKEIMKKIMFYNKIFTPLSFKIVTNEKNMNKLKKYDKPKLETTVFSKDGITDRDGITGTDVEELAEMVLSE